MAQLIRSSQVLLPSRPQIAFFVQRRAFSSKRIDRRGTAVVFRRADLSEEALEREVRKGLDQQGDYTRGELPEQPEFLTHWSVDWSEPQTVSLKHIFTGWFFFFGGLFVMYQILRKDEADFYPLSAFREELGNRPGEYGVEYVASLESKGIHVPGLAVQIAADDSKDEHAKH